VVLGESFSGPLALMLASDPPARMLALILACTFEHHPRIALASLSMLANAALRFRPPKFLNKNPRPKGRGIDTRNTTRLTDVRQGEERRKRRGIYPP
jgi:pimeloyl-ACP methyl ester carboxylesterase